MAITGAAATIACEEAQQIPAEPIPNIPVPSALSGYLSADGVQLFWEYDSTYAYGGFVVSRSEDDQSTWFDVATVDKPPYADKNLRSQTDYWYRVAGLDLNGVRSNYSVSWPARPAVYEVFIDDGADKTNSLGVLLTFTAASGTQNVRFAETQDLTGIPWRDFLPPFPFTLTQGDGVKTVWAQFIDAAGNLTEPVSSTITLDTYAAIASLSFNTVPAGPDTISPGGTVFFSITAENNETPGFCDVYIEGQGATPVQVLDDGRNGDTEANDGVYERVYTFNLSFRQASMRMSAEFTDDAGNLSDEREFADNLYMSDPPDPVTLFPITETTSNSITLNWKRSTDDHFASYQVYRRVQQPVDPVESILVGTVSDQSTTVFTDSNLPASTSYWYAVFVVNDLDEGAKSNEEQGTTNP
jgi:hypothetical protein